MSLGKSRRLLIPFARNLEDCIRVEKEYGRHAYKQPYHMAWKRPISFEPICRLDFDSGQQIEKTSREHLTKHLNDLEDFGA